MARPKADVERIKRELLDAAEQMLSETGGRRLVQSELAARVGLSQSYAHRFFATKDDLVRAFAARWFEAIEAEAKRVAELPETAAVRLHLFILSILRLKRARFDEDPALYYAYLELAAGHVALIKTHSDQLTAILQTILQDMVAEDDVAAATALVEDATVLFRIPSNIAAFRDRVTDKRAEAVVNAVLLTLCAPSLPTGNQ